MLQFGVSEELVCTEEENRALLGYYPESSGNFLPTFRDNLSVPSPHVKNAKESFRIQSLCILDA